VERTENKMTCGGLLWQLILAIFSSSENTANNTSYTPLIEQLNFLSNGIWPLLKSYRLGYGQAMTKYTQTRHSALLVDVLWTSNIPFYSEQMDLSDEPLKIF
jgi:hypothetical protein